MERVHCRYNYDWIQSLAAVLCFGESLSSPIFVQLLNSASSVDTPLNTLAVLKSKQKSAQSPYILVSGGAQSLLA